jgi:hypothetical protein
VGGPAATPPPRVLEGDFDFSRLNKDGQVLDSSRDVITREDFDKRYACSS